LVSVASVFILPASKHADSVASRQRFARVRGSPLDRTQQQCDKDREGEQRYQTARDVESDQDDDNGGRGHDRGPGNW